MKGSHSVVRRICWLIVMFAVAGFSPSEFGGEHKAVALEKKSTATPIIILDERGRIVLANTPSATSQISDVAVGPNNTLQFVPNTVNISAGDTVRWTWMTGFHSVTSGNPCIPDSQFCSPNDMNCAARTLSGPGTVYQHLFAQAGTYSYFCAAHCEYGMTGVVSVCTPPPANMVSWWGAEGNARDALGSNDGVVQGGTTFAAGMVGQAFNFDGSTGYVEMPDSASLSIPGQLTIDAWIKPNNVSTNQDIVTKYDTCDGKEQRSYAFGVRAGGAIEFCVYNGQSDPNAYHCVQTTSGITPGVFTHVAGTFDPATQAMKIYLNGVDTLAPVLPGSVDVNVILDSFTPVDIGRTFCAGSINNGPADYFGGPIDEVEIFNRALSALEIQAIANAGSAGKCRALQLTAAASRKTHGGAGTFDINMPIAGQSGVECRSGGANGDYTLVFTFSNLLLSGNAAVTGGTGTVSGSPTFTGRDMIVNVTGVTNAQILTVTLSNVTDVFNQIAGNTFVNIGFLAGDTNGNRTVNAADVAQTKARLGQAADGTNFRSDVNANGSINAADVAIVKANLGTALPP
jgi:plastocyanin